MPKNCVTCKFYHVHSDEFGFDGCTCVNDHVKIMDDFHRYCNEFCDFEFNTKTDDGKCPYWASESA